jgi:hypothetical protein
MKEVIMGGHSRQWLKYSENPDDLSQLHALLGQRGYQATCDFPSAAYWKEQLKLYPDSKVVLTVRDPDSWYKSCSDTIFKAMGLGPNTPLGVKLFLYLSFPFFGFGEMSDKVIAKDFFHYDFSKEGVVKRFREHTLDVQQNCPKDKLLVFEVSQGWAPLCEFLNVPIPDVPFPRVNDTKEFGMLLTALNVAGYASVGIICTGVFALGMKVLSKK